MEVPSTTTGVLAEIRVPAGEVAPVGAVVAVIADGARGDGKRQPRLQPRSRRTSAKRRSSTASRSAGMRPLRRSRRLLAGPRDRSRSIRSSKCARRSAISARRGCRRNYRHAAGAAARSRGGHRSWRMRGSGPHGRIVAHDVEETPRPSRAPADGPERRRGQGALRGGQLRGGAARRHAPHHCGAADAGGNRSAFLSHGGCRDRPADGAARGSQRRGAEGKGGKPASSSRSTISSSARWRSRCSASRRRMRSGPAIASCASSIPISASRSRSTAA